MNTLRYALRFLLRARTYTLINLLGLAFSLACCIILLRSLSDWRERCIGLFHIEWRYAGCRPVTGHATFTGYTAGS